MKRALLFCAGISAGIWGCGIAFHGGTDVMGMMWHTAYAGGMLLVGCFLDTLEQQIYKTKERKDQEAEAERIRQEQEARANRDKVFQVWKEQGTILGYSFETKK